ncbi:grainyhead-like protein 3 homolog isoform X2 [Electrophorus electricus]|uniref:grainyhead-like protein 3 homolog isoform X2 n=1 Tax=Electrophorus electricus TaxID=8005 RepID=UPI0015D0A1EB|nr:grainyhead-like protein 3 homolog isoform X2 [Electrophorus electricus]
MTKETETLMVLQNETFNYSRYPDTFLMDSWNYMDSVDISKAKPRPPTDEDLASISFIYDTCKTQKDPKMSSCSRGGPMFKQMERTSNGSSPELTTLENSAHIMKMLSESISADQVAKQASPCNNGYIRTGAGDSYDKQVINNIFDSLLLNTPQKPWQPEASFSSTEVLGYSSEFVGHPSPVYSDSYSTSSPERYRNDFQFILGAPQASQNRNTEMSMVYLNKGQFYPITLQGIESSTGVPSKVKTVIMAVFENEKSPEMQLKCWNHWHARQPTAKQRVIDIADYKEVFSGISHVDEVAFNALSFIWNTSEEAKVYIGINSLSTDFSSQKGVKGLPLNLQIDTYDFSSGSNRLVHRAACQVKVFCDKGAERKMRDEERKRSKRRMKSGTDSSNSGNAKQTAVSSSVGRDCTFFKTLDDHVTQPVLFIPETHYSSMQRLAPPSSLEDTERNSLKRVACYSESGEQCALPPSKQPRKDEQQRVLLYVRQESEEVFDALMLETPTLRGLRRAISEKYSLQEDTIGKIFKKCKRGIFVNMDDNIIEHYSNHSAFLIEISEVMVNHFQVTLMEL